MYQLLVHRAPMSRLTVSVSTSWTQGQPQEVPEISRIQYVAHFSILFSHSLNLVISAHFLGHKPNTTFFFIPPTCFVFVWIHLSSKDPSPVPPFSLPLPCYEPPSFSLRPFCLAWLRVLFQPSCTFPFTESDHCLLPLSASSDPHQPSQKFNERDSTLFKWFWLQAHCWHRTPLVMLT